MDIPDRALECEKRAVDSITKTIYDALDVRAGKSHKKNPAGSNIYMFTLDEESFWEDCIAEFAEYDKMLDFNSSRRINSNDVEIECTEIPFKAEHVERGEDLRRVTYRDDSLEEFRSLYENDIRYVNIHDAPTRKKCDRLFKELCRIIDAHNSPLEWAKRNHTGDMLGHPQFDNIGRIIDLGDPLIRRLLPYLLTAYTRNFSENHALCGNIKYTVFGDKQSLGSDQTCKIREQIRKFSSLFTLSGKRILHFTKESDRPSTVFSRYDDNGNTQMAESPYIVYANVLWDVFKQWNIVICKAAKKHHLFDLQEDIDIEMCERLMQYYISEMGTNESLE